MAAKKVISSRDAALTGLYAQPMRASRAGALFSAFPYPTKISPEAIALFIAAHTRPGETVFDAFAGSGTTGLATLLCENPTKWMCSEVARLKLDVEWGPRNAMLYEIGALGAFISRVLTNPPDPHAFEQAAEKILNEVEEEDGWLYAARDPDGKLGKIRHVVWSDVFQCPSCHRRVSLWESSVTFKPARISADFSCPHCGCVRPSRDVTRVTQARFDPVLRENVRARMRRPVYVYGSTGKRTWSRAIRQSDKRLLRKIEEHPVPASVPLVKIPWGDLYRSGYHDGVTHLHHLYTHRNLVVLGTLWSKVDRADKKVRDALRFWILSYNAAHATNMTRIVAKSGHDDFAVTSAQSGVLYVSGLPVEKNLISGLRRKLATIRKAFDEVNGSSGAVEVVQRSSCSVDLPAESVDYVFTDPPFGGNIPYSEVNFINEAWLGHFTDNSDEAIISRSQGKTLNDYQKLLTSALREANRILKKSGVATVVFHSANADVWNALQSSYIESGFSVASVNVLDKVQGSFKQVTTNGAVQGDPVILLGKMRSKAAGDCDEVWSIASKLIEDSRLADDPAEQTAQRLYSRLIAHFLQKGERVPVDAQVFYRWCLERVPERA